MTQFSEALAVHWPDVIAGFLLGLSPALLRAVLAAVDFVRNPDGKKFFGTLYLYHWSLIDESLVREKIVVIRYSWIRARIVVHMPKDDITGLEFVGEIVSGRGTVRYFFLRGVRNSERLLFVLNDPLTASLSVTNGIFTGVDVRRSTPLTGRVLLSATRLTQEKAKEYLQARRLTFAPPLPTAP
ncbi:hypothetical protein [Caballeronia grimmiae]|uniref:hypothetical protein n=1 Tax=Caballeronia grimmiae TaxID=1071679 RepID=UPI0038BCD19F